MMHTPCRADAHPSHRARPGFDMIKVVRASESQDRCLGWTSAAEHIEIVEGAGGPKARIRGHRIRVVDVVGWYEKAGMSADEILEEFPTITKADIYAALA
jgi:uncharacterized protein (DUF433 family)